MDFFTVSTFRETLSNLTKKPRDGYMTVVKDICNNLQKMNDDILRNTNDRVKQYPKYRIVKLRLPNTGQHLAVLSVTATLPSSSNNDTNGSAKAE